MTLSAQLSSKDDEASLSNQIQKKSPPDGGYAWVIVLSSFLIHAVIFGVVSVYGIYLARYNKIDFPDADLNLLTMIGGLAPGLFAIFSIVSGTIMSLLGHRLTILVGAAWFCAGLVIASFATLPWHLVVGQALFVGVGLALCFVAAISVPPPWFSKTRGLALGICASGAGAGGLVLGPLTQLMIDQLGFRWSLRITAIVSAVILAGCAVIMKAFVPPEKSTTIIDIQIVTDKKFILIWLMGAFVGFAYWVPFFLMGLYCEDFSLTTSEAAVVIGLLNGGSAVGRIVAGPVSDRFGNVNSLIVFNFLMGLTFPLIWNFATVFWSLIVFALVFGILSGGLFTIIALLPAQLFDISKLPQVNGPLYSCLAPGYIAGTIVAKLILDATPRSGLTPNYTWMLVYLMILCAVSSICLIPLKFMLSKQILSKV